jgi:RNA polymerase sigma-70 factor (ECF subfamily)
VTDFATELEPHIPALRRFAWAMVRDPQAADDLVQDCLERAMSHWHTRRGTTDARAWLFTILRNLFLNRVRQEGRRGRHVGIEALDDFAGPDSGAERIVIAKDALAALQELSEDHRALLLLIGVEELSYQEAADVFGVPIGTIMSRLSRARAQLRQIIESGERVPLRRVK